MDNLIKQPKALRLADLLHNGVCGSIVRIAAERAAALRRLHKVNTELLESCKNLLEACRIAHITGTDIDNARAAIAQAEGESK